MGGYEKIYSGGTGVGATLLSGSAFAHEARREFFMRAGPATVRPTEGAGGTLGHLNGFDVVITRNSA